MVINYTVTLKVWCHYVSFFCYLNCRIKNFLFTFYTYSLYCKLTFICVEINLARITRAPLSQIFFAHKLVIWYFLFLIYILKINFAMKFSCYWKDHRRIKKEIFANKSWFIVPGILNWSFVWDVFHLNLWTIEFRYFMSVLYIFPGSWGSVTECDSEVWEARVGGAERAPDPGDQHQQEAPEGPWGCPAPRAGPVPGQHVGQHGAHPNTGGNQNQGYWGLIYLPPFIINLFTLSL